MTPAIICASQRAHFFFKSATLALTNYGNRQRFSSLPINSATKCTCSLLSKKIEELVTNGDRPGLRSALLQTCNIANRLSSEWSAYSPQVQQASICTAASILHASLL